MSTTPRRQRDPLRTKILDAKDQFEATGGRFIGPSLSDLSLDQISVRSEGLVLEALLRSYRGESAALIAYTPSDPESPFFEPGADVLIAHPEIGCVLIEVKSHSLDGLSFDGVRLCVHYEDPDRGKIDRKDVFRQVRRRVEKDFPTLLNRRRRRAGSSIPIIGAVALPRVSETVFLAQFAHIEAKPIAHLIFQETLEAPSALRERLGAAGRRGAAERNVQLPIASASIDVVAEALGMLPRGLRSRRPAGRRSHRTLGEAIDRLRESNALTPDQRAIAHRTLEGHPTLLRGVAGSGKSILLACGLIDMVVRHLERAPSDTPKLRLLVICFNRTLVPLLRDDIEKLARQAGLDPGSARIEVMHLEALLRSLQRNWGIAVGSFRTSGDRRFPAILAAVETLLSTDPDLESELWDHVFVDEAQDLHPEALRLLHRLARENEKTGERGIAIYYDDAQNLYGQPRPIWRDLGIHLVGRSVQLQRCRRTTRPIATLAFNVLLGTAAESHPTGTRAFSDIESLRDSELVIETEDGLVVEFAPRPGPAPVVIVASDPDAEVQEVVTRIGDLLRCEEVREHEILIQSDGGWHTLSRFETGLEAAGIGTRMVKREKDGLLIQEGRVTLSTIYSAKGYDAPVVFVVNAQGFKADLESRARFYVGATRAQLLLIVTAHGEPGELMTEIVAMRKRLHRLRSGTEG